MSLFRGARERLPSPAPSRSPTRRRVGALVGAFVVGTAVLGVLGVAGYRGGFALCAAVLAGGGGVLTAVLVPAGTPSRSTWVATVAVLGLVVSGVLLDRAPLSTGNLARRLDGLRLPNERLVAGRRTGHSWCLPRCPAVERRFRAPLTNLAAPLIDVGFALSRAGIAPKGRQPVRPSARDHFTYVTRRIRVTAVARYQLDRGGTPMTVLLTVRFANR